MLHYITLIIINNMVLVTQLYSNRSDLLERVGEGCGETSFCVLVGSNCEECGVDGMCASFRCLSDFFRFAWGLRVIANLGPVAPGLVAVMV